MVTGHHHAVEHVIYGWHVQPTSNSIETRFSMLEYEMADTSSRLLAALSGEDRETVDRLLEEPLEVNYLDSRGVSLLMVAAYRGYHKCCERLISLGADALHGYSIFDSEMTKLDSDSVLSRAQVSKDWPTIGLIERTQVIATWNILKEAKDPARFADAHEWLREAARLGMTSTCVEMVGMGVPVDSPTDDYPPVREAAFAEEMTTCLVLLAMGADINPLRKEPGFDEEVATSLERVRKFFSSWRPSNTES